MTLELLVLLSVLALFRAHEPRNVKWKPHRATTHRATTHRATTHLVTTHRATTHQTTTHRATTKAQSSS